MSVLTSSPYSYTFDSLVLVRISAYNSFGWGSTSTVNSSGAKIRRIPDTMSTPYVDTGSTDDTLIVSWTALTTS